MPDAPTWYARPADEALNDLRSNAERGLSGSEARSRLDDYGENRLAAAERPSASRILFRQFKSVVVYILAAAAGVAAATGEWPEAIAVAAVIAVNAAIGFASEWKAAQSMARLRAQRDQRTRVRRDGQETETDAAELVPGDIVLLRAGDLVPADLRLVEAKGLRVNEAALTGESVAVNKSSEPVEPDAVLAEHASMAYRGTTVSGGEAVAVVTATAMDTQLGQILDLAHNAEDRQPPLQDRLDALGKRLAFISLGLGVIVAVLGLTVGGRDAEEMVRTAIALAVAAIPEGLPIVATIALARGMWQMARVNAIVNRLTAVETLGATRVVFTDKTGTLTENKMRLDAVLTSEGEHRPEGDSEQGERKPGDLAAHALKLGVLCNTASVHATERPPYAEAEQGSEHAQQGGSEDDGDPTELALLHAGRGVGLDRGTLIDSMPEAGVHEFDPEEMRMATVHEREGGGYLIAVKGATVAVLDCCSRVAAAEGDEDLSEADRDAWLERSTELAARGLRVLALADKQPDSADSDPYAELRFVGLVGLLDPAREGVRDAIGEAQAAGVRVVMITGDQPATGFAIAQRVGIVDDNTPREDVAIHGRDLGDGEGLDPERMRRAAVFARTSPRQKLAIVRSFQDQGETVAMTGDGVNDAPALKQADIGIAMGQRGTEAAKQVADMILTDDRFQTIVSAIRSGRVIFDNIRRSAMFMLCTNIAEVLAVAVAAGAGWPIPLTALQILYLNVLTDVFPALALAVGPASGREMERPPRPPGEPVLAGRHWLRVALWATLLAAAVLAALLIALHALGLSSAQAVTVSFLTLGLSKLWFPLNLRDATDSPFRNSITRNPWVWGAAAMCVGLLAAAVYLPGLNTLLSTVNPGGAGLTLAVGASLVTLVIGQIVLLVAGRVMTRNARGGESPEGRSPERWGRE